MTPDDTFLLTGRAFPSGPRLGVQWAETAKMIAITGNTFPVKDQLKALGGRWNAADKAWMVPQEKADEARALVTGSAKTFACDNGSTSHRPSGCKVCGKKAQWNSRGYPIGDRILRSGECQSCFEERKMGY